MEIHSFGSGDGYGAISGNFWDSQHIYLDIGLYQFSDDTICAVRLIEWFYGDGKGNGIG